MEFSSCFIALALMPILAVILMLILNNKNIMHSVSIIFSTIIFIPYLYLLNGVLGQKEINVIFPMQFFMDGLNALVLGLALLVGIFASVYLTGYLDDELKNKSFDIKKLKLFYVLFYTFQWTMIISLISGNLGQMWIAIEASTLSSAFLVGFYNNKKSIEAAWKYVIICSLGIAMALLGIIFLHIATVDIVKGSGYELNWHAIINNGSKIDTDILRLSFIFTLLGFGTKAGLAPMNTWLPDSYSQAPAPISAVLSGVLSNISMYAILREIAIVNKALGSGVFTGNLMFFFALLSMAVAAIFIINQKDYKRLLAYSSIEHMGIVAFGLGIFTPASVFASLLHMCNHSLTKSMLFFAAGNVQSRFHTKKIAKVKGLLKKMPLTGFIFFLGIFAITGMPPFSIFISELSMVISGFDSGHKFKSIGFVFLITIIFIGFAMSSFKMFYGDSKEEANIRRERNLPGAIVALFMLILIIASGLYMPGSLINLITMAQKVVTGG